jgi:hypothetical protein
VFKNLGQTEGAGINNGNTGRQVDVRVFYDVLYNTRENVTLFSSAALGEKNIQNIQKYTKYTKCTKIYKIYKIYKI